MHVLEGWVDVEVVLDQWRYLPARPTLKPSSLSTPFQHHDWLHGLRTAHR